MRTSYENNAICSPPQDRRLVAAEPNSQEKARKISASR